MKSLSKAILAVLAWTCSCCTTPPPPPATPSGQPPRLVVIVSIDQLPTYVFGEAWPHFGTAGFRRLAREGTRFTGCAFRHACTETGPGHATLITGAPGSVHGIVKNEWFDAGKIVYCVRLQEGGPIGPESLLVPTFGELMKQRFGSRCRIGSVSWKDRSAILLGGPDAEIAVWVNSITGVVEAWAGQPCPTPDWLSGGEFFAQLRGDPGEPRRVWRRFRELSAYADLLDDRKQEKPLPHGSNRFPHVVFESGVEASVIVDRVRTSPLGNELVDDLARRVMAKLALGRDEVPDLMCISFSSIDYVGHTFGPRSVEVRDMLLRMDARIARLLEHLDEVVGRGQYLFLLSSDHGIAPIPAVVAAETGQKVGYSVSLQAANRARVALRRGMPALVKSIADPIVHADSLSLWVAPELRSHRAALRMAAAAAATAPGVARAMVVADLIGQPSDTGDAIDRAVRHAAYPIRSGDILLVPKRNWIDSPMDAAAHGSPYDYDREVPLFVMGPGVRSAHTESAEVSPGVGIAIAARILGMAVPRHADRRTPNSVYVQR